MIACINKNYKGLQLFLRCCHLVVYCSDFCPLQINGTAWWELQGWPSWPHDVMTRCLALVRWIGPFILFPCCRFLWIRPGVLKRSALMATLVTSRANFSGSGIWQQFRIRGLKFISHCTNDPQWRCKWNLYNVKLCLALTKGNRTR